MSLIRDQLPEFVWNESAQVDWDEPTEVIRQWRALAFSGNASADIEIFDVIGEDFGAGISDKMIADQLRGFKGRDVRIQMNSPGGDVFTGLSIYNLLRNHSGKVTIEVTGMAASAASVIAMAADEIVMGQGSLMMIHNAWGMVVGNQHDLREAADFLEKIDGQLVGIYAARTGQSEKRIASMMADETFFTHEEAVKEKFADRVDSAVKVTARADTSGSNPVKDRRRYERALARLDVPRHKRSEIINMILDDGAPRDASPSPAARDAGNQSEAVELMRGLMDVFKI